MAQTKKTVKKTDTKSRQTKIKENKLSDRVKAIIFLALAILIFAIMIVPGVKVWRAMHNFMYGVFGICGFAVVVFLASLAYGYLKEHAE